jgi:hypothetical protein
LFPDILLYGAQNKYPLLNRVSKVRIRKSLTTRILTFTHEVLPLFGQLLMVEKPAGLAD